MTVYKRVEEAPGPKPVSRGKFDRYLLRRGLKRPSTGLKLMEGFQVTLNGEVSVNDFVKEIMARPAKVDLLKQLFVESIEQDRRDSFATD